MSRALNKDTLMALGEGNSSAAFQAISKALAQPQSATLLEIEILPKSHILDSNVFLLLEEHALAISKIALVKAFFMARKIFQGHHSGEGASLSTDDLLAVTSVILVMDPEHLTAANSRKRLIVSEADKILRLELISKDKYFVDSLLTSRLHRHTKSPTLWSHRRWLIKTARSLGIQLDVGQDVKLIVLIAGERHPKNYYGWCHARWLTSFIHEERRSDVLQELVSMTKSWCFRNHSDISGWSFLSFLAIQLGNTANTAILDETLQLAISFRWTNESTWVFLRTLAASAAIADSELVVFNNTLKSLLRKAGSPDDRRVAEQTKRWFETYRRRP